MALSHELTPQEFYEATLSNQGLLDDVREITKEAEIKISALAEERGLPVEVVKLAEAYYGQMDLDGLNYDDKVTQREDALKIAEAYYNHTQEVRAETVKVADAIMAAAMDAAEKVAAELGTDFDGFEALKIAALQADTAQAFCQVVRDNHQLWQESVAYGKEACTKAQLRREMYPEREQKTATTPVRAELVDLMEGAKRHALSLPGVGTDIDLENSGYTRANIMDYYRNTHGPQLTGVPKEDQESLIRNALSRQSVEPHLRLEETLAPLVAARAQPAPAAGAGDWMSKHKGKLMLGGVVGAGALYMLKKKRDEENRRREDELNILRARALPPA